MKYNLEVSESLNNFRIIRLNIVTDLINALPANSALQMVQHTIIDEAVLSMSSATPSVANEPVNSQHDT
jgi:hypothetical protein